MTCTVVWSRDMCYRSYDMYIWHVAMVDQIEYITLVGCMVGM